MGEPVKIVDIAEELIRIHSLEPYKDIDIKFTGLRPGEKLLEKILTAEEGTDASQHARVFVARNSAKFSLSDIEKILEEFHEVINKANDEVPEKIRALLKRYVKHYEEKELRAKDS